MVKKYRKILFIVTYIRTKKGIKYLLLKRKLHWKGWEFPKGGIESKENINKAIKREIKEETGQIPINIKKHKESGKFKYKKILKDRPNIIGSTYTLYSAELKNKKIKIDKLEHSRAKWLSFNKAIIKLTWPNQKRALKIVNKKLTK